MVINRAQFISLFLYQIREDEFYGNPGSLPSPAIVEQAVAAAKDIVDFDLHRSSFALLAETIDVCTAQELALKGSGIAARNANKHPKVIELKNLNPEYRAGIAVAAAQGLAWMENCRPWVKDTTLRNQIAKRVMTAILFSIGRIKKGYSTAQLTALSQIGSSLEDMDLFVIRAREAIDEIVSGASKHAK